MRFFLDTFTFPFTKQRNFFPHRPEMLASRAYNLRETSHAKAEFTL